MVPFILTLYVPRCVVPMPMFPLVFIMIRSAALKAMYAILFPEGLVEPRSPRLKVYESEVKDILVSPVVALSANPMVWTLVISLVALVIIVV